MIDFFWKIAKRIADAMGSAWAFIVAVSTILVWAITGPVFGFSDTWQLVINTGTTVVTFLMVFLIQNTQNRDAKVTQLKLDELLHGVPGARTRLVDLEECSEEELEDLHKQFQGLRNRESRRQEPDRDASSKTSHNGNRKRRKAHAAR
jgi:low affinity Fe/Cu permease